MMKVSTSNIPWKEDSFMKQVFDIFGHENIFFVGGAVRNVLLKKPTDDFDLSIKLDVVSVKKKLLNAKIRFIDLSKGHGTVTLLSNKNKIEITSMRVDTETYGRKAKVEYVNDIFLDSCRRDFTINSIYSSFNGEIYDPHNGTKDLKNSIVKFIGKPTLRIKEDRLRILRYFRFLSYFGCSLKVIDKTSMDASLKNFNLISSISVERKSYEFYKLIFGEYAGSVLSLMKKEKVLHYLLPGLEKIKTSYLKVFDNLEFDKVLRISYLLILSDINIEKLKKDLYLSKKEFDKINKIYHNFETAKIRNVEDAKSLKYRFGAEISIQIYYFRCFLKKNIKKKEIEDILKNWIIPTFPLTGNDLKKIGLEKGKDIGSVLKKTKDWWAVKGFSPNKTQCLVFSKKIISSSILH